MDKRKYITETDILDKESRINLIMDMLDLIMKEHMPTVTVNKISLSNNIKKRIFNKVITRCNSSKS